MKSNPKGITFQTIALAIVSVIVIGWLGGKIARTAGEHYGDLAKERLQLQWPRLLEMQENDRALLVGLAMTCHVERRPAVVGEVVECLHSALDDPRALLPKGVSRDSARSRLDQLLRQRSA